MVGHDGRRSGGGARSENPGVGGSIEVMGARDDQTVVPVPAHHSFQTVAHQRISPKLSL
jgi:hypothetical protein